MISMVLSSSPIKLNFQLQKSVNKSNNIKIMLKIIKQKLKNLMYGFCMDWIELFSAEKYCPFQSIRLHQPRATIKLLHYWREYRKHTKWGGGIVYFYFDVSDLLFKQNFSIFYVKIVNMQMHKLKLVIKRVNCKDGNARFTTVHLNTLSHYELDIHVLVSVNCLFSFAVTLRE